MAALNTPCLNLQNFILRLSASASSFSRWLHFFLTGIFNLKGPKRSELPATLTEWRDIQSKEDPLDGKIYTNIWANLEGFFTDHQFTLFHRRHGYNQTIPDFPSPSNYIYYPVNESSKDYRLKAIPAPGSCHHAARKNNRHFIIRVMSVGKQGLTHLHIMRLLSNTVPDNLYSNHHILPMVEEIWYGDISFGVFPLAFGELQAVLNPYLSQCTLEEALHLVLQALEAIIYIHGRNIAHCDLYTDNFLVDFIPNSLVAQHWTRPHVYLMDFEAAVHFPDDSKPSERLVSGFPFGDLGLSLEGYNRKPPAPELLMPESHMYCPFKLDIFQFGSHLVRYLKTTGFEELDSFWPLLMSENPADRPTAKKIFGKLGNFVNSTPPKELQRTWDYEPVVIYM